MLVKYCFDVVGSLVFREDLIFESKGRQYEFGTEDDYLKKICVTVREDAETHGPKWGPTPNQPNVSEIKLNTLNLPFIQIELLNLEGLLSPFGIEEIDIKFLEIFWTAETEEEKKYIQIPQWKYYINKDKPKSPQFPKDLMARAILSAYDAEKWQIPLAFYRKGLTDYKHGRFLEACFDYYFMIETLFADGKFKNKDVKANFKKTKELHDAIHQVYDDHKFMNYLQGISPSKFMNIVQNKPAGDILGFFVDFRGLIHHHSGKDKKRWHPANNQEFKFEAELFANVCFHIGMKIVNEQMFCDQLELGEIKCKQKNESSRPKRNADHDPR